MQACAILAMLTLLQRERLLLAGVISLFVKTGTQALALMVDYLRVDCAFNLLRLKEQLLLYVPVIARINRCGQGCVCGAR